MIKREMRKNMLEVSQEEGKRMKGGKKETEARK